MQNHGRKLETVEPWTLATRALTSSSCDANKDHRLHASAILTLAVKQKHTVKDPGVVHCCDGMGDMNGWLSGGCVEMKEFQSDAAPVSMLHLPEDRCF
jgi:hypothetical protein